MTVEARDNTPSGDPPGQRRVVLSAPCQALPAHEVTTEQVLARTAELYAELQNAQQRKLERSLLWVRRITEGHGVNTRFWVRRLGSVLGPADLDAELSEPVVALRQLAADAASRALAQQGLTPDQIDCVIVTSVTGWVMPGIDAHVINALGLPPTVVRIPAAQIGCAGGAWAAARAWEHLAVFPDHKVLIISAEAFSNGLHANDTTTAGFIYRGLAGDGVFACIAAAEVSGPGLRVHGPALDYLLPDSTDAYELRTGSRGTVFTSLNDAPLAVAKAMPAVRGYLRSEHPDAWEIEFVVCHNGGRAILQTVAEKLPLSQDALRHSYASLRERGNMTSAGIWDVFSRTVDDPPRPGSRGLMLAFGPGFTVAALKVSWVGLAVRFAAVADEVEQS
jgi:predicted naringenin-chalcone synthase